MRLALFAALLAIVPCAAADPPTIDKLIEQLGSRQFAERERATKQLRERGPAALPALRKALESKDEEIRKRAEVLIPPLEIEEALLPKRVSIRANNQSLNNVLNDVEKQTGSKVIARTKDFNPSITLNLSDTPFWEAMDRLGEATETAVSSDTNAKTLSLVKSQRRSPHVDIRGPFRLEATWFHEDRDIDFTQAKKDAEGQRSHRLTLAVSVLAEPRLTFLRVQPAKVEEAVDADGKSLIEAFEPDRGNVIERHGRATFRGEFLFSSDIRLRRASETAKAAKIIRGTIPVKTILIRKQIVVTSKLLESTGTNIRAGSESLQITRVQNQGGGSVEVKILVPYDRMGNNHDKWYERFHVEDDAGNRFRDHGRGSESNGMQYWISLYYGPPNGKAAGPPTKLIFEDWIVHEHAIPFEFKNVPLP